MHDYLSVYFLCKQLNRILITTVEENIKMTKFSKIALFLLFLMSLTLIVSAQRTQTLKIKPKPGPTPKAQTAREKEQRRMDEETVRNMADSGFDMAVVVKDSAIRETASATGKSLLAVKRNTFLSLAIREADRNWYNVVEVDSGTEGWINGNDVVIKLTANTQTGPPLEEAEAAANALPEVSVSNLEEKTTLRIRLNGKLYMIPPGTTKVVQIPAGNFKYYGWSPGIRPATGSSILEKGKKYSWKFKIFKRPVS